MWTNQWNYFASVAAVNTKIFAIDCHNTVTQIKFAHTDQTEIGKVRLAVLIPNRERVELSEVIASTKGKRDQPVPQHPRNNANTCEVKGCFS